MYKFCMTAIAAAGMLVAAVSAGNAQATRTWVSGVGADDNPCSRTAPCKTFAGAISKTATGGEISVLDPGGFGGVTITKSISIVAEGQEGGILGALTTGILINSPTAVVNIRGLVIEGGTTGLRGVRILQAASVHIEKTIIRGFNANPASTSAGVEVTPTTTVKLTILDSTIADNLRGIIVQPSGGGAAQVMLSRVMIRGTGGAALRSTGASSVVWLNQTVITDNATGVTAGSGGVIHSYGNNVIVNNTTNGSPTDVIGLN